MEIRMTIMHVENQLFVLPALLILHLLVLLVYAMSILPKDSFVMHYRVDDG